MKWEEVQTFDNKQAVTERWTRTCAKPRLSRFARSSIGLARFAQLLPSLFRYIGPLMYITSFKIALEKQFQNVGCLLTENVLYLAQLHALVIQGLVAGFHEGTIRVCPQCPCLFHPVVYDSLVWWHGNLYDSCHLQKCPNSHRPAFLDQQLQAPSMLG